MRNYVIYTKIFINKTIKSKTIYTYYTNTKPKIIDIYYYNNFTYDFSYDFSRKIINIIKIVNELIIYSKASEIISVINSYFISNTIIITFVVIKFL